MVKEVARGITAHGRSKSYHRRGLWAIKAKNGGQFPVHPKQEKAAAAEGKAPKFYPSEDAPVALKRRNVLKPTRLRSSISPGTVLILLAGRFKGRRVVFLKQLPSGLLLVTGPFKLNGVPLRRVNQAYVIATSKKIEVEKVDTAKFDDAYFKAAESKTKGSKKKTEDGFFNEEGEEKKGLSPEYVENQKAVDAALLSGLEDGVKSYLSARFTLKSGDRPHLMKF